MKKTNYALNFTLIVLFTSLSLYLALYNRFEIVMGHLKTLSFQDLFRIFMYGISYTFIIGWIYKLLGKKYKFKYTYKEGLQVAFVGSYFSGITPSATGGQFGQIYVLKKQGVSISDGASLLWKDFILYQSTLVLYTFILMVLRFSYYYETHSNFFIFVLIGFLVNSVVIVFLFTMAFFPKLYAFLCKKVLKFLQKVHIIKNPEDIFSSINEHLLSFTKEIRLLKDQKDLIVQCVLLNIVRLTLLYAFPMYIAKCMHIDVSFGQLLDIITMSAFVFTANAFFPLPGSSGGSEAAFLLIFQTMFTIDQTSSIMIIWRFATYHLIMIIGGIVFACLKYSYDHRKLNKIRKKYELEGK